jgi:hypothetical protein
VSSLLAGEGRGGDSREKKRGNAGKIGVFSLKGHGNEADFLGFLQK